MAWQPGEEGQARDALPWCGTRALNWRQQQEAGGSVRRGQEVAGRACCSVSMCCAAWPNSWKSVSTSLQGEEGFGMREQKRSGRR